MPHKMRIAVLASGNGTNADAILSAVECGKIRNAEIATIISDNPDAGVFKIAQKHGFAARYIDAGRSGARFAPDGTNRYVNALRELNVDMVVLAGFMRILPPEFVDAFDKKMINLHPSLLPAFKGKDAIKQAFDAKVKVCGCTVHYVGNELDGGEIISQKAVEIPSSCTLNELENLVHKAEHALLPKTIDELINDK